MVSTAAPGAAYMALVSICLGRRHLPGVVGLMTAARRGVAGTVGLAAYTSKGTADA